MIALTGLLARHLHRWLFVLLAFALVGMGSVQTRAHVLEHLAEHDVNRLYETQAIHPGVVVVRIARLKMGRKPYDHPAPSRQRLAVGPAWALAPAEAPGPERHCLPAPPRAPPFLG